MVDLRIVLRCQQQIIGKPGFRTTRGSDLRREYGARRLVYGLPLAIREANPSKVETYRSVGQAGTTSTSKPTPFHRIERNDTSAVPCEVDSQTSRQDWRVRT